MDRLDTVAAELTEAVGVFDRERDLERAVDALLGAGFDRADLSLLASAQAVTERLGYADWQVRRLEDDPRTPTVAYASGESRGDGEGAVLGVPMYVIGVTAAGPDGCGGRSAGDGDRGHGARHGDRRCAGRRPCPSDRPAACRARGKPARAWRPAAVGPGRRAGRRRPGGGDSQGQRCPRRACPHRFVGAGRADLAGGHSRLRQPVAGGQGLAPAAVGLRCPRTPGRRGRGHGDCQGDMLRRITEALMALGAEPDPERSAPTRQGGA